MNTLTSALTASVNGLKRHALRIAVIVVATIWPFFILDSPVAIRVAAIVSTCIALWLLDVVPPYVPTLLLWVLIPVFLSPVDTRYSLATTLRWAADPVLALFFGGFALGVATGRHGLDKKLASWAFSRWGGSFGVMLLTTICLTAFLSMWISNIAAAALMFASLRPLLAESEPGGKARRTLLVGVALGANLGGIATPVGTGPNGIAISFVAEKHNLTFLDWMVFAFPLTVVLLGLGFVLLRWRARTTVGANWRSSFLESTRPADGGPRTGWGQVGVITILGLSALLWLTESFHGISAPEVAMAAAASLFLFRLLKKEDIGRIDWSTLLLIAGGITVGKLLEASQLISYATRELSIGQLHPTVGLFLLCLLSASLSALMSNTATVVFLIPIASAFMPEPSTAILIAISASFGMPFVISTPPNAMAYGEGGIRQSDLLVPGLVIMLIGCAVVSLTGRAVLNLAGIP